MTKKFKELFPDEIENVIREKAAFKEYDISCIFVISVIKNTKYLPFIERVNKLTLETKHVVLEKKKENGKYEFNETIIKELMNYFNELFKKTPIYGIYF